MSACDRSGIFPSLQCVLVRLEWAEPMMFFLLHVTCSCIFHTYIPFFFLYLIDINYVGTFLFIPLSLSLFLSLSFFRLVALWHLNGNLLCIGTLFVPGHLLFPPLLILHPPMFGSMMIKLVSTFRRTFHDTAFI